MEVREIAGGLHMTVSLSSTWRLRLLGLAITPVVAVITSCQADPVDPPTDRPQTGNGHYANCSWPDSLDVDREGLAVLRSPTRLFLVDPTTGELRRRCEISDPPETVWFPHLTRNGVDIDGEDVEVDWPGRHAGGHPSWRYVANGSRAVADLVTGDEIRPEVPGFIIAAVVGQRVLMAAAESSETRPAPSGNGILIGPDYALPESWCVLPDLRADAAQCSLLEGAINPGSPIPHFDGSITWAPLEGKVFQTGPYKLIIKTDGSHVAAFRFDGSSDDAGFLVSANSAGGLLAPGNIENSPARSFEWFHMKNGVPNYDRSKISWGDLSSTGELSFERATQIASAYIAEDGSFMTLLFRNADNSEYCTVRVFREGLFDNIQCWGPTSDRPVETPSENTEIVYWPAETTSSPG
jgi:hypothetical protein